MHIACNACTPRLARAPTGTPRSAGPARAMRLFKAGTGWLTLGVAGVLRNRPHGLTMGRRIPRKNTSTAREWLPASGGRVLLDPLRLLRLEEEGAGAGGGHAPREATATPLTVTGQMPRGTRGLGVVAAAALSRGSSPAAGEDAELEGSWGHDHKPLGKSTPGAPGYSEEPTPQALLSPRRVHSPPRWDAISGLAAQRAAGRSLRISKEWQVHAPQARPRTSPARLMHLREMSLVTGLGDRAPAAGRPWAPANLHWHAESPSPDGVAVTLSG